MQEVEIESKAMPAAARSPLPVRRMVTLAAGVALVSLAAGMAASGIEAVAEDDSTTYWSDSRTIGIVAVMAVGVSAAVGNWAARSSERRPAASIGSAIAAVLLFPLFWFSPLPTVLSATALLLSAHLAASGGLRLARVVAILVIVVTFALYVGSALAAVL